MILLVNPAVRPDSPKCLLNVGLGYVASALEREGFEFEILDIDANRYDNETVERLLRTKKYDAVGIGTLVSQYAWAKWVASVVRDSHPTVPIVAGNTLGTSVPDTILAKTAIDVCCLGEGDETAPELFRALLDGGDLDDVRGIAYADGRRTATRPVIPRLDEIPTPNYELFDLDIYLNASK